jgi:hypothetical protein
MTNKNNLVILRLLKFTNFHFAVCKITNDWCMNGYVWSYTFPDSVGFEGGNVLDCEGYGMHVSNSVISGINLSTISRKLPQVS